MADTPVAFVKRELAMTRNRSVVASLAFALAACTPASDSVQSPERSAPRATQLVTTPWPLPVDTTAAQPDLVQAPDGSLLLSWIEPIEGAHALRFARYARGAWSAPRTVAEGRDWFVNWADTPHIRATADGALWAHWLRRSAAATYAYDVVLSRSADDGATWSVPIAVNDDGTPTEHGFVSLWAAADSRIGVAWLDGRRTGGGEHAGHDGHGSGGAMTLRSAVFDAGLQRSGETELDASTCDCCQTDVVVTSRGALLAYRDRTAEEIRDIAVSRLEQSAWSTPRMVHADGWRTPGCPVNGPAITARGERVLAAWYTEAPGKPTVRVASSQDAGDRFGAAHDIATGPDVLGRVAVASAADADWVAWLEERDGAQRLEVARMSTEGSRIDARARLAAVQGRGRGTGVPQLVVSGGRLHAVWTDVVAGQPRLQGAMIEPVARR